MHKFHEIYRPLTARPFLANPSYREYPPCKALSPFISCFWSEGADFRDVGLREGNPFVRETGEIYPGTVHPGTVHPGTVHPGMIYPGMIYPGMIHADMVHPGIAHPDASHPGIPHPRQDVLVIPDSCMDIIIQINHTTQKITGFFCSIQDEPFVSVSRESTDRVTVFAIRFYFWSAHLFLKLDYRTIKNQKLDLEDIGNEWKVLFQPFLDLTTPEERIGWVEPFLLKRLEEMRQNDNLLNSFHQILWGRGRLTVKEICGGCCISQRQLERQFLQSVGLPMKRVSNLVRYQNVWRDMILSNDFHVQNAVYRYGYVDQSHLLKEFKRFHGVTPEEAKSIAYLNR